MARAQKGFGTHSELWSSWGKTAKILEMHTGQPMTKH